MFQDEDTDLHDVLRGAAYLDSVLPDWYTRVDTDHLDMGSARFCIAGQVFAERASHYNGANCIDNGYDLLYYEHNGDWLENHGFLFSGHGEWIEQINARLIAETLVTA